MTKIRMPRMLSVAGSDSGGGAGIQADVRSGTLLGCHVSTAITALTAQNSMGVTGVFPSSPMEVVAQIDAVLSDIGADSVKTGMLFDQPIISAVAAAFRRHNVRNLVVDPVMVAKGGQSLLQDEARDALIKELLPLALVVTPNLPEAEALAGMRITSPATGLEVCKRILAFGAQAVLLKGGHGDCEVVQDLLVSRDGVVKSFASPRIHTAHTHGTGCTLSAAIAAELAKGCDLVQAVTLAHGFLQRAITNSYATGNGHGSTNPYRAVLRGKPALVEDLFTAWELLEEANPWGLIPEVQSNLAQALPDARNFEDVAAFPGRITKHGKRVRRVDGPRFGASRHMAKILLASARHECPYLSVMNIRYGHDVLAAIRGLGYSVAGFSRADEPQEVKAAEGSTLEWGTSKVLSEVKDAPDAIFDEGDMGKEPMIRIFGRDAVDVVKKVSAIWKRLEEAEGGTK